MAEGQDLEAFLAAARFNLGAPVEALPPCVRIADNVLSRFFQFLDRAGGVPSLKMLLYSHSAWRQSLIVIQSGGTAHAPAVMRSALEASLYGYLFRRDPDFYALWEKREEDQSAASKFRNGGPKRARDLLRDEKLTLHDYYTRLERNLITFGAHPNFLGVEPGLEFNVVEGADTGVMSFRSLSNSADRMFAYYYAAQVAHVVGHLYALIYPTRAQLGLLEDALDDLGRATLDHSAQLKTPSELQEGE
jgi:hypothetical protein